MCLAASETPCPSCGGKLWRIYSAVGVDDYEECWPKGDEHILPMKALVDFDRWMFTYLIDECINCGIAICG